MLDTLLCVSVANIFRSHDRTSISNVTSMNWLVAPAFAVIAIQNVMALSIVMTVVMLVMVNHHITIVPMYCIKEESPANMHASMP